MKLWNCNGYLVIWMVGWMGYKDYNCYVIVLR